MAEVQDIVYGVSGQSIYLDVPEGRPSAATVTIYRDEDSDENSGLSDAVSGSPSVDSFSTTFDGNAGAGQSNPKLLPLASPNSAVIGRQYLATTAAGSKEWVEITALTSGVSLLARTPLMNAYVNGDTFVSARVTQTLATAWLQDLANISDGGIDDRYRARWVVTVGGVVHRHYTYFRLVRMVRGHSVRPADIERLLPGFLRQLPTDHRVDRGAALIDEAYAEVAVELQQEGFRPDELRDNDLVNTLVKNKAIALVWNARAFSGGSIELAQLAQQRYQARFDALVKAPGRAKIPVDADQDGTAQRRRPVGITEL